MSKQTGSWKDTMAWESSPDNIHWAAATLTPDTDAASITVRTAHTLTVTNKVFVDNLITQPGSTIITNTGVHFVIQ